MSAVIEAPDGAPVIAFSFVAGVEPFLAAAPRTAEPCLEL